MSETLSADPQPRTCVLVLGMHRSGSSALTRVISLLGAALPKDVMGASESNEAGHWEPSALVDLHDEMLAEGGSAWNDWRPFDPLAALGEGRLAHYRAEIMREIEAQFAGERLFVLKDPRISRFAPLYLDCLAELGIAVKAVLTARRASEIAGSLRKRNAMPEAYAMRLWLRHNLDAEAASRNVERIVVSYDRAMEDPYGAIQRLRKWLASATPEGSAVDVEAARASLRRELRHHVGVETLAAPKDSLRDWAERIDSAFAVLELDGADPGAKAALDGLRARVDEDARSNGDDLAYAMLEARGIRLELRERTRQRDVLIERVHQLEVNERALEKMLEGRDALVAKLREDLANLREDLARQRRQHIIDLASTIHPDYGEKLPKQVSPWRALSPKKRKRIRQRREDYLAVLNSPLFDAEFYLTKYPDVAARGEEPILHYLSHGSNEGRWPSAAVDPVECKTFFRELRQGEGNLVLRLIALLGPEPDES